LKILIVGLGRMGYSLAEQLDREGHAVYAVDHRNDAVERARARLDIMVACGSGCSIKVLQELGAQNADLIIAASGSDEVNIVSCLVAREIGVKRSISRLESRDLVENLREMPLSSLGIDEFVNPREETVKRLCQIIRTPGTTMSAEFAGGDVELRGLRVEHESQLTQLPLMALQALFVEHFLVSAVQREQELIIPKGDFQIQVGDIIHVVLHKSIFRQFLELFDFEKQRARKIFVYGAKGIGLDLCRELEDDLQDIVLIDEDWDQRKKASAFLKKTSIIDGSPRDNILMQDLKINTSDYFIGASESEEANFSSALIAKRLGVKNAVMLTDHPSHVELFDTLPLDAVLSPVIISVGAILKAARAGSVLSMFNIAGGRGEALEIVAHKKAQAVGTPLKEIKFPAGIMIAATINSSGFHIASGATVIQPGDRVIIVGKREIISSAISMIGSK